MLLIVAQELCNVIFLDFMKAFDTVPHCQMMKSYLAMEFVVIC